MAVIFITGFKSQAWRISSCFLWQQISYTCSWKSVFHERTRHIDIDCHVVLEKLQSGVISLLPIHSHQQLVDCFTKALAVSPSRQMLSSWTWWTCMVFSLREAVKIFSLIIRQTRCRCRFKENMQLMSCCLEIMNYNRKDSLVTTYSTSSFTYVASNWFSPLLYSILWFSLDPSRSF